MALLYSTLPPAVKIRVGQHPDTFKEWCGYNPDHYSIAVFLKGIYKDLYLCSVTAAKANFKEPWLDEYVEEDPDAFLGDGFRHIELGKSFVERYVDINEADQPLGPVSGHHLNIITETDHDIEKFHIRTSHNRDTYAAYFDNFSTFSQLVTLLKGNLMNGINDMLALIVKSAMLADPSLTVYDDREFARIYGRTSDNPTGAVPADAQSGVISTSKAGTKFNQLAQEITQKYYSKSLFLWPNIQWYNTYHYAADIKSFEPSDKALIFEDVPAGKDRVKRQKQKLYTDAHETSVPTERTTPLHDLHRNDCLFALFYAVKKAITTLTTRPSMRYWLGNDTSGQATQGITARERLRQQMPGILDGQPILPGQVAPNYSHNTTASTADGFEVMSTKEFLFVLMNPDDYDELHSGIGRTGPIDSRSVKLSDWGVRVYPFEGMKPGFVRLLDKRAFRIRSYFQMTDVQTPMEQLTWRYKMFYQIAPTMFRNFGGCLFVPTPHFVASADFYNVYGLYDEVIEKKK